MKVITLERAIADGIDADSLRKTAAWNDAAVKLAKGRKDARSVSRHQAQSEALRAVAAALDAR